MSVFRVILSSGNPSLLAVACIIAVKKDIGLKRPEIQRDFGAISSSLYSSSYLILKSKSSNHVGKSFKEG